MEKENEVLEDKKEPEKIDPNLIVKNHVIGAMAVGLLPLPLIDLVALTGVQINMLRKLSQLYTVSFQHDKVRNILASLIGAGLPVAVSGAVSSFLKFIPVIGQATGAIAMPILSGASTYAVGKVFIRHFESGGTFLTFNPDAVKEYYEAMFKEGQEVASHLKKNDAEK
ncbi:MAG: DUF697 domain-containing protein [Desulfobacterales bacterium]|nr:DUF697 domain-containing protein [Desulfobacterales bacterium]